MRKLNSYLAGNLLAIFILAIAIGTFVMMIGQFARVFELVARGVPLGPLMLYVLYRLPQLLGYTLPLALLVSVVLLFNRLSADNEITAMRASGISLLQVTAPLLLFSLGICAACFALQFHFAPRLGSHARQLVRREVARSPLALLEERTFNEPHPGFLLYIGRKEGNQVYDLHIYRLDHEQHLQQDITAARGELTIDEERNTLTLTLFDAVIVSSDPDDPTDRSQMQRIVAERVSYPVQLGGNLDRRPLVHRISDMNLPQMLGTARLMSAQGMPSMDLYIELNLRAALALAPFSFLLLGIPLGLRIGRKETAAGLVGSILAAFAYFGLISFFETLGDYPQVRPDLLMWTPNIACQALGAWGVWRNR